MIVFGTRPEAIKMAPLVHALKSKANIFNTKVCVTAQHREMLDQVLKLFKIKPDVDLDLMTKKQDLFATTSSILMSMQKVFAKYLPDIVLVHGDTTTTFATSLASFYAGIQIGHVEAGLRTHNLLAPFPEEFNRQVVSKLARWNFAPTELCKKNLLKEGVPRKKIIITGNTIIDSLNCILLRIKSNYHFRHNLISKLKKILPFDFQKQRFILVTCHRRENFGIGLLNIYSAIKDLANHYKKIHFVYPVHMNPHLQKPIKNILTNIKNIHLIEPQTYEVFIYLLKECYAVLTDSGGVQEEAPNLGKPVLVMRDVTERPEAFISNSISLVGVDQKRIFTYASRLLEDHSFYKKMSSVRNPFGDGNACKRIVEVLSSEEL